MERRERLRQPTFIAAAAAIIAAPFLALLWSVEAGLALLAVALSVCGLLLGGAMAGAPPSAHRVIRVVVAMNLALAIGCVTILVYRLAR